MKKRMTEEEKAAAKKDRLDQLKDVEVTFHPSKKERKANPETWGKWPPGVFFIESAAHSSDGNPIRTFYVRGKVQATEEAFFEKAERPGHRVKDEEDADKIRTKLIEGTLQPNRERRKKQKAAKQAKAGKWTLDELWAKWKADPENAGKRGTHRADQRYRAHISADPEDVKAREKGAPPPLGNREPKDLRSMDIDRLRLYLVSAKPKNETTEGFAKASVISIIGLITRIARYGASKGRPGLSFPVILKGRKLGREPEAKRAPTDDQTEAFIKTCESWPDRQVGDFMLFVVFQGVRRGSVWNLKMDDVDFNNQTVLLRDSKTGDVPIVLSNDAVALLRSHPRDENNPYVFQGADADGRLTQRQIDREPAKIRDAAGLPADLDPCHSFRRRLATKVEAEYGIATAMKAGGWKSPAMVINYTATSSETLRKAANLMGRKNTEAKGETA